MRTLVLASALLPLCGRAAAQDLTQAYAAARAGLRSGRVAGAAEAPSPAAAAAPASDGLSPALVDYLASLPANDVGKRGRPGSPLALVFIGDKPAIANALRGARWTGVPRGVPQAFLEGLGQLLRGAKITKFPPFHYYTVEGRKQDANWAQVVRSLTKRHHFRLWKLNRPVPDGRAAWWGSASYDTGIRWRFIIPVTHNTDPNVSAERDYIASTLGEAPGVSRLTLVDLPQIPRQGINNQKDHYVTDGKALVVEFGPLPAAAPAEAASADVLDESVLSDALQ